MDLLPISEMADRITVSQDLFIKSEVEDALPGDFEKPFHFTNHLLSPKREDVPLLNLPSISGPRKFEYNAQELRPKCYNNEEVEHALPCDSEKPFHFPKHLLSQKPEDVAFLNLPSISGPCKFDYDTQESEPKCFNNEGHFSPRVSGLHLHGNTSLVISLNPSTNSFSNGSESDSEGKGLKNQKACLKSCLQSKKYRKLERYQRTHKVKKTYLCKVCDKMFSRMHDLNRHQRVHTGEKPFNCDVCKKGFSELGSLNTHRRIHTGEKPFKCDVCDQTFSQAGNLNQHQRVHTGEKPFKCNVCFKTFPLAHSLNKHQRVHTGEKPFKCDVCKKCFSELGSLNRHRRVHTGEKPFKCDVCDQTFSQAGHLNQHQRMHTGEKPFKCDVCKKYFSELGYLNKHQRVHAAEKPFKCHLCKKCFSQPGSLNKHQRVHTPN